MRTLLAALLSCATVFALPGAGGASEITFPPNCSVPADIPIVGASGGIADGAFARFGIVLRTIANNPIHDHTVALDFGATPGIRLGTGPLEPNDSVDCVSHRILAVTDANGLATFVVPGSANGGPAAAGPIVAAVWDVTIGFRVGDVRVCAYDLDGQSGVNLQDLAIFAGDFYSRTSPGRSDFDGNGVVDAADLGRWARVYFSGLQQQSATPCP
jgi:hypothetical protein